MKSVQLLALEATTPPHRVDRETVRALARSIYGSRIANYGVLERVFETSTVGERWLARPPEWYIGRHGWADRAAAFEQVATALLAAAAGRALAAAGIGADAVDQVLCVSTTGFATPSLDARLMAPLGLRADVRRTPVFGWGCAGGAIGLSRAAELARASPGQTVMLLVVELCSLAFRPEPETVNVVGSALFGDGAAAAILRAGDGDAAAPSIGAAAEHTWPDSLDVMGWRIDDGGFGLQLRRDLPAFLGGRLRPAVDRFLDAQGLALSDIAGLVAHPGGPKVLDAVASALGLAASALDDSRAVLERYGNPSAAGILIVLRRALDRGARGRHLLLAMGPGFTAALALMEL